MSATLPPGPTLVPLAQALRWGLRPDAFLDQCAATYGDTFSCRFAGLGDAVFFSRPQAARDLFTAPSEDFTAGKTKFMRPIVGPASVLCLDGPAHLRQRRLMLSPLHGQHLGRMRQSIDDLARAEVATWLAGEQLVLAQRLNRLSLDIILRVVFGVEDDPARDRLRALIARLQQAGRSPLALARLSLLRRDLAAPPHPSSGLGRLLAQIDQEIAVLIAARSNGGGGDDVLSMLLAARDEDGVAMAASEVRDELMTMLLAGHETTASSLAWVFERLVRHPQAWQRLRCEAQRGGTEWADAVVSETLRVRPVLWLAGRRMTYARSVDGVELPAGTLAYVCSYLLHRRPELWPDPLRFAPERFLDGRPAPYTFLPFGGGSRRCIGAAFARMQMRTVLLAAAAAVDLAPIDLCDERMVRRGVVIAPREGARVRVLCTT